MGNSNTSSENKQTTQATSQQTNPWAPTQGQLTSVLPNLQNAFQTSQTNNANTLPSNFIAGLTPGQIQNFQQMLSTGMNTGGATNIMDSGSGIFQGGAGGASSALGSLLGFNPSGLDPSSLGSATSSLMGQIDIPSIVNHATQQGRELARDVTLPGIDSGAAGTGNTNSSRTGVASGLVERGLAENAQNMYGSIAGQLYPSLFNSLSSNAATAGSQRLGALQGAGSLGSTLLGQGAGAVSSGINDLSSLLGLGAAGGAGIQQGNQLGINNQLAANQFGTQNPFASIGQYLPLLESIAGLGGQSTGSTTGTESTQKTPSALSTIGSLMGAGGSLLGGTGPQGSTGLGGMQGVMSMATSLAPLLMMSDERVKEDIHRVGRLDDGTNVYSYKYINDPNKTPQIGVLAQEVEKTHPEAVATIGGLKAVHYGILSSLVRKK